MICEQQEQITLRGGRCAFGPVETVRASIQITGKRITSIQQIPSSGYAAQSDCSEIDLSGLLVLPGLINAHDHLEFALFPRLGNPPYRNYIDWGIDIHNTFPDVIAKHRAVPKSIRVWWGGIRNLLCGATTVSHHNPLYPELQRDDFPVRVIQQYGWAHSFALGGDLHAARAATPQNCAFIMHACEGVDDKARSELWDIDRLRLLDASTVLVHGLAIDRDGVALMIDRGTALIVCPSSNNFLFGKLPDLSVLGKIDNVAIGNDSPLTAEGDILEEIKYAIRHCNLPAHLAYRMVTDAPAEILRLQDSEGSLKVSGVADLIVVRDTEEGAADRLRTLSMVDIELVMLGGRVQLASEQILERLPHPTKKGLEPLSIGGTIRWLRAPVKELLRKTEEVLGAGEVRLGGKPITIPA
jgi:hypothetical protein